MKTILITIITVSFGLFFPKPLHADVESFQAGLQAALTKKDQSAFTAFFNFEGLSFERKEKVKKIIEEICSWEEGRVRVEPFEGSRLEEFSRGGDALAVLNGKPEADVFFSAGGTRKRGYSMLVGSSEGVFLILLPKDK